MENLRSNVEEFLNAAGCGDTEMLSKNLEYGIDVNIKNNLGWNAMTMAAWKGNQFTYDWLQKNGGKLSKKFLDTLDILEFEINGNSEDYKDLISQLETACGIEKRKLDSFKYAYSFEIENKSIINKKLNIINSAIQIWDSLIEEAQKAGFYIFIGSIERIKPAIQLVPSCNKYVALLVTYTTAIGYGEDTFNLIQKLKKIEKKWPFRIKRCYHDGITLKFLCETSKMNGLAMALVKDFEFGMNPEAEADELESIVNSTLISKGEIDLYWG